MNKKKIIGIVLAVLLIIEIVVIAVLSNKLGKNTNSEIIAEEDEVSNSTFLADYNGEDASWDDSIAEHITLNGNGKGFSTSNLSSDTNNVSSKSNDIIINRPPKSINFNI